MRICFVLPGAAVSGGIRVMERFASGLLDCGHHVRILYRCPPRGTKDFLHDVYFKVRYSHRQNWLSRFSGELRPFRTLTPELVGQNDLVIGTGVDSVLAMADLPPQCGIRVHECQGMEPWTGARMLRAWQLAMPRIVVASHLKGEMLSRGVTDDIYIVHNGIDRSEYFSCVPADQRNGVGTVYHGTAAKDPAIILATLNVVHEQSPQIPLYVFGSFPRPKGLPSDVTYVRFPSLQHARELYSRSLVWFCSSRWEGFPAPVLEAMACGCAPVSTNCGGPADMIQDGVNGVLVQVGDVEALASNILRLLQDDALRRQFVAASQTVLQRLTWTESVARFESALESIVDGN